MKKFLLFFIVFLGLFLCACKPENDPAGTVRIVVKDGAGAVLCDVDIDFTEEDTLISLMETHADIQMQGETDPQYGYYVQELCGVKAENAYWAISVDGEYSMVGISLIPLTDGSLIEFVLTPIE